MTADRLWLILGLAGQAIFGGRFVVQWIASERRRQSHIPIVFWYMSLVGGAVTLAYAIHKKDPVFIIGQGSGVVVYIRNLMLIHRAQRHPAQATTPDRA
ncbi:MAG TPA: lipid-A-disaccharide synthase N-terminal domain-containing protein [Thermoanaerobaculia bacterium]|nr:lipid-A-disaccharide synthase N-terminal domain-containing protein [Thermoanaerobaculia bacterium]